MTPLAGFTGKVTAERHSPKGARFSPDIYPRSGLWIETAEETTSNELLKMRRSFEIDQRKAEADIPLCRQNIGKLFRGLLAAKPVVQRQAREGFPVRKTAPGIDGVPDRKG